MILKSDFIMPFGVNKGYSLAEIYHYLPSYIEWLVKYVSEFEINIEEFETLQKPLVHYKVIEIRTNNNKMIQAQMRLDHKGSVDKIKKSNSLKEINFHFSEETRNIILKKRNGLYESPIYESPKIIASLTVKEFNEHLKAASLDNKE